MQFALPLDYYAQDNDYTFTLLSNDVANQPLGSYRRSSFRGVLPGVMDFRPKLGYARKRGLEDGDEDGDGPVNEWRVTLHKAIIHNYQENSPVVRVIADDGSLLQSLHLPLAHYANWNQVLRTTYDALQIRPVTVVKNVERSFREQLVWDFQWSNSNNKQVVFTKIWDTVHERTLESHQHYMQKLYEDDATVGDILAALVNNTEVLSYDFSDRVHGLRNIDDATAPPGKFSTVKNSKGLHINPYGYYLANNHFSFRGYNYSPLYAANLRHLLCLSSDMGVMLGLHERSNYTLVSATLTRTPETGDFVIRLHSTASRINWTQASMGQRYASTIPKHSSVQSNALMCSVQTEKKTITMHTDENIRILITNKEGNMLAAISNGDVIPFGDFFSDSHFEDGLQSEIATLQLPNVRFRSRTQGTSSNNANMQHMVHPIIPLPTRKKVIEFYPKPKRHERKLERQELKELDVFVRNGADWNKEVRFHTGSNAFVFTFSKGGVDWYNG